MNWVFIIAWLISAGVTYGWAMETNKTKLKKLDPSLYEKVKDNPELIKDEITVETTKRDEAKTKLEEIDQNISDGSQQEDETTKKEQEKFKEEIVKSEGIISLYQAIEKGRMNYPEFSFNNIAWTLGTFFVVGLVLSYVLKKIVGITNDSKNNN